MLQLWGYSRFMSLVTEALSDVIMLGLLTLHVDGDGIPESCCEVGVGCSTGEHAQEVSPLEPHECDVVGGDLSTSLLADVINEILV